LFKNKLSPFQLISLGYLLVVGLGALLLMLPLATVSGHSLSFINALFTSASATCVTGLTVVHTAATFNGFGQAVLLLLIQIGGLGYMALATLLALILRRKISLRDRVAIQESFNQDMPGGMVALILKIIKTTVLIEIIGTAFLFIALKKGSYDFQTFWLSLFHAVSAFCNSGLDLFQNSLIQMSSNSLLVSTIGILIILGGLGFVVLSEFQRVLFSRSFRPLSFHSKVVISMSVGLVLIGFLGFWWHGFSALDAFFMSVTARTAGFSTLNVSTLSPLLLMCLMCLMFIGASPGGTGGGVKTTTLACLFLPLKSTFQKKKDYELFGRRVPFRLINRAMTLVFLYVLLIILGVSLIHTFDDVSFRSSLFEVISALGTVGLSLGITGSLSSFSKLVIVGLMLVGRIGPLTVGMTMALPQEKQAVRYPAGRLFL